MDVQILFDMLELWPMARANYAALDKLLVRTVSNEAPTITLMFNPERVRSTMAKVNASDIARRQCFLCSANRPAEQKSLVWRDYDVLANPFPIFKRHLTIATRTHRPQDFEVCIDDMYLLANELPQFSVFFNGPMCGASAPDHLHFQAGDSIFAPSPLQVEVDSGPEDLLISAPAVGQVYVSEASQRLVYHMVALSESAASTLFARLCSLRWLRKDMLNAIARSRGDGAVDFYIIPRRLFRPWQFSAEEGEEILISPATVEVAGIFVLPRREDYDKMTRDAALDIMKQVCFSSDATLAPVRY